MTSPKNNCDKKDEKDRTPGLSGTENVYVTVPGKNEKERSRLVRSEQNSVG